MDETTSLKFDVLKNELNERQRRLWAASEALCLGHGGVSLVSRATGLSRTTINFGIGELESGSTLTEHRVRRKGGGRKKSKTFNRRSLTRLTAWSNLPPRVSHVAAPLDCA